MKLCAALLLALLLWAGCSGLPGGGSLGSNATPLGNLVRVERRQHVTLKGEARPSINARAGETLYLLWFEGKTEIRFEPTLPDYPLQDAAGREFPLVFAGSPTPDGGLTAEGWRFESGGKMSMGGRWAYGGTARLPDPKVVLVYAVPADARPLKLVDKDQEYELPAPQPTSGGRSESTGTLALGSR